MLNAKINFKSKLANPFEPILDSVLILQISWTEFNIEEVITSFEVIENIGF